MAEYLFAFRGIKATDFTAIFFLVIVLFSWPKLVGAAQIYYVSPDGNDAAAGSISDPWKTPQKAASEAVAGDIIYLRSGVFRPEGWVNAMVNFQRSGSQNLPIRMTSYPGEMAVLNGMLDLSIESKWILYSSNVYYYADSLSVSGFDGDIPLVVQDDIALEPRSSLASLAPGQIYFDAPNRRLYVWANGGGNPGQYHLEVSQSDSIFRFDPADQYIVLENLTITGAYYGIRCVPNGGHRIFRNLTLKHFKADAIKFNTTGNNNDLVEHSFFSSFGDFGIDTFGSSHQIFRDNEFTGVHYWKSGGAIKSLADGNHHLIEANYIHDLGGLGWEGALELREAENIRVVNNLIANTAGPGVLIYGEDTTSTPVPDPTSVDVEIINNTFYQTKSSTIWISEKSRDITVKNNIVMQRSSDSYCLRVDAGGTQGFVSNHNDFYRAGGASVKWLGSAYLLAAYQNVTQQDLSSLAESPLLIAPDADDFQLSEASPAIDRGDSAGAPEFDMEMTPRPQGIAIDLGAYERASVSPPLPVVEEFNINGGAATTTIPTVTLNNLASHDPRYYMASEDPGFSGATWRAYSQEPLFTLSIGSGSKTVYFKTKNNIGESDAVTDTITLAGNDDIVPPIVQIDSPQPLGGEFRTTDSSVAMSGIALDDNEVVEVAWSTSRGESGIATGTDDWQITQVILHMGENHITVSASDGGGNIGEATLLAVRESGSTEEFTEVRLQVSSSADDGYEALSQGFTYLDRWKAPIGKNALLGYHFDGITVPPGATIISANLYQYVFGLQNLSLSLSYRGEAAGDAAPFTTQQYDLSQRVRTLETVTEYLDRYAWMPSVFNPSPDLKAIIQEIVSQSDWQYGNALNLFIEDEGSAGTANMGQFEHDPAVAAQLEIQYTNSDILPPEDTVPPQLEIRSPTDEDTYQTNGSSITLAGIASDNVGIYQITWENSHGDSGTAEGTTAWSIAGVSLLEGENVITVTASDLAGNTNAKILRVTRIAGTPGETVVVTLQLETGTDDGYEALSQGLIYLNRWKAPVGKNMLLGYHFADIPVPIGATILSAHLSQYSFGQQPWPLSLRYSAEASGNAASFTPQRYGLSQRIKTLEPVTQHLESYSWTSSDFNPSPDLKAIIQKIVSRSDWQPGNALNLFVEDQGSAGTADVNQFEHNPNWTARLEIRYRLP